MYIVHFTLWHFLTS